MTALVAPGNWDGAGGNDLIARDASGRTWGSTRAATSAPWEEGANRDGYGGYTIT